VDKYKFELIDLLICLKEHLVFGEALEVELAGKVFAEDGSGRCEDVHPVEHPALVGHELSVLQLRLFRLNWRAHHRNGRNHPRNLLSVQL
jgi:hypothetical protein